MLWLAFLVLRLSPAYGNCLVGSIQGLIDGECYRYHETPTNWYEAEEKCVALGGHLTSVGNGFENAFLSDSWNFGNSNYWLGGRYGISSTNKWTWTDGKPFHYTNWAKGQPANGTAQQCLAINLQTSRWSSNNCFLRLPFICRYTPNEAPLTTVKTGHGMTCPACPTHPASVTCPSPVKCPPPTACTPPPNPPRCPVGWTYLALTNKCYKYFDGSRSGIDAVALCIAHNAVLTSIHSYAENSFLFDLSAGDAWLGLYSENGWRWVDGSPLDYTHWLAGYPGSQSECVYLIRGGSYASYWANYGNCLLQLGALCSKISDVQSVAQ